MVYIYRQLRASEPPDEATARDVIGKLFFSDKRYDLGDVGRFRINKKLDLDTDPAIRTLTREDIIAIIKYLIQLINSQADVDDIDHLSNRRVRTVGEQLSNQFSVGFVRMARTIRERMNVRDNEVFTPVDLINAKTLSSVINSFFGTSQLSQFMDQINPLAEITHKRRLSALGPGGLSRDRPFRGARRALHALRTPLPDRVAGRPEHRSDLVAVRLCEDLPDGGLHRDALPQGIRRQGRYGQFAFTTIRPKREEGLVAAQANAPSDGEGNSCNPTRSRRVKAPISPSCRPARWT